MEWQTFAFVLLLGNLLRAPVEPITIPAFTAYLEPEGHGTRVSSRRGIMGWTNDVKALWFGEIKAPGAIQASVELQLPESAKSRVRLTASGERCDRVFISFPLLRA